MFLAGLYIAVMGCLCMMMSFAMKPDIEAIHEASAMVRPHYAAVDGGCPGYLKVSQVI